MRALDSSSSEVFFPLSCFPPLSLSPLLIPLKNRRFNRSGPPPLAFFFSPPPLSIHQASLGRKRSNGIGEHFSFRSSSLLPPLGTKYAGPLKGLLSTFRILLTFFLSFSTAGYLAIHDRACFPLAQPFLFSDPSPFFFPISARIRWKEIESIRVFPCFFCLSFSGGSFPPSPSPRPFLGS